MIDNPEPRAQLEAILTRTQMLWLRANDKPDSTTGDAWIGLLGHFSAAWYLKTLIDVAPEAADAACDRLRKVLLDGGAVGEWTWDLLVELGVDPINIPPAPMPQRHPFEEVLADPERDRHLLYDDVRPTPTFATCQIPECGRDAEQGPCATCEREAEPPTAAAVLALIERYGDEREAIAGAQAVAGPEEEAHHKAAAAALLATITATLEEVL